MSAPAAPSTAASAKARLPRKLLLSYGAIAFTTQTVFTINAVHLLFFYTDTAGLRPGLAGLVIAIAQVVDAITNPLMGALSDRIRWRRGRRRPFFIPGCVLTALCWILVYRPPVGWEERALFLYMLVLYLAYTTARTSFYIPWVALAPDLTQQYDERSRVAAYRAGMGVPGDVIGGILPLALAGALGSQRQGFGIATIILGTGLVVGGIIAYRGTYERVDPRTLPPPARDWRNTLRAALPRGWPPLLRAPHRVGHWALGPLLRTSFGPIWSRPTAIVFGSTLLGTIGTAAPLVTFRYLTKYYFGDESLDTKVMFFYFIGALLSAPCWQWMAGRWDKKRAFLTAIVGYIVVTSPIIFLGPTDGLVFVGLMVLVGFCGTGLGLIPNALSPDVVEWNRLHLGAGHEGLFYGIWGFLLPCGYGLAVGLVGATVDAAGFVPGAVQTAHTLQVIRAMFIGFPLVFLAAAAVLFAWYPITRAVYNDVRRRLHERDGEATHS